MLAFLKNMAVLLCVALVLLSGETLAADRILPIGATAYPPFEYASRDGQAIGADTELIEQVLKRMGYVSEMRLQPWTRVESAARRGDLAAIYSVLKNPEREAFFYFSDPVSVSTIVFFKRKEMPLQWQNFDELKALRVATCAGYAYPKEFVEAIQQKKFASVAETFGEEPELVNFRNLKNRRVDLVITDVNVGQYLINKYKDELEGIDYSPRVIGSAENFYLELIHPFAFYDDAVIHEACLEIKGCESAFRFFQYFGRSSAVSMANFFIAQENYFDRIIVPTSFFKRL